MKLLHKTLWKAVQHPTEKPKIKFNVSCNLRWIAAYPSINAEKREGVPAELKSPEWEGGNKRINTKLDNSYIF